MNYLMKSLSIFWLCVVPCVAQEEAQPRLYTGAIEVPTVGEMGMSLAISDIDEGMLVFMSVPMQGAENIPLNATYLSTGEISATLLQAGIVFTLKENDDQTELTGKMLQSGFTFTIEFKRVDALPTLNRPQTPTEPFVYSTREVTSLHPEGHLIAGTLTIPSGEGPFPCAVLISGSGQQDRNESLMGHQPFLIIANYLSSNGIAVLRYDDRGVGGSVMKNTEDVLEDTSADFATDAALMVQAARMHPEIDARRVGIIGHSEGGLIGPMVAINDSKLAFIVMLAGPGMKGLELLPLQQTLLLRANGASQDMIDAIVNVNRSLFELAVADASEEEMYELVDEAIQLAAEFEGPIDSETKEGMKESIIQQLTSPWIRYFLEYEPMPTLAQVSCPVLAMNGTLDLQVPSRENLSVIEEVMTNANRDITIIELEGLNHLFQPANTGNVTEYAAIEITFDQNALELMGDWVTMVTDDD